MVMEDQREITGIVFFLDFLNNIRGVRPGKRKEESPPFGSSFLPQKLKPTERDLGERFPFSSFPIKKHTCPPDRR